MFVAETLDPDLKLGPRNTEHFLLLDREEVDFVDGHREPEKEISKKTVTHA